MSKGLFTRREEDPDTRKILEGETTFRLGLHVEISVRVVNSREGRLPSEHYPQPFFCGLSLVLARIFLAKAVNILSGSSYY